MKKLVLSCMVIAVSFGTLAQTMSVSGEVKKPLTLSVKDLGRYPQKELAAKDREGKEHTYRGTFLSTILDSAGVTLGKDLRGESLAKYVLITAADNYQVVYSLAEIDPDLSNNAVLLATSVDGTSLPKGEGPFRLVNTGDKRQARWIREIVLVEVKYSR